MNTTCAMLVCCRAFTVIELISKMESHLMSTVQCMLCVIRTLVNNCAVVVGCQASTVIELSSVPGVTLDSDERYTVRLLSVDGGAVLGNVVSRTLLLLASASPSGVMQLYFAGSRHDTVIVNMNHFSMLCK